MKNATTRVCGRSLCILFSLCIAAFTLAGCASSGTKEVDGLKRPVAVQIEPWNYGGTDGHVLTTAHYRIFTTVAPDESLFEALPQLMEGAYTQYRRLAPPSVTATDRPMDCYVFGQRSQWADFTVRQTGPRAKLYLQISVGAYALGDVFVAYDIGDYRTLYTASHEGWHQFAARHFKGELPRFLEEGMATQFENVRAFNTLPRWDLKKNANRAQHLRRAIEGRFTFSLAELINLNAGDVVHRPGDRIDAFYSQNWAFVRFLFDGENGKYRAAFQQLMSDVAAGTVRDLPANGWSADNTAQILTRYLNSSLPELDRQFTAYCRRIAFTEFMSQWE